jgi:anhydro-N-acetylmuramic acid kinase
LNIYHALLAADAVKKLLKKAPVTAGRVSVIGYHGQTIQHRPNEHHFIDRKITSTLQLGDGATLAALTQIPVVNNFRTKDMAYGGSGAPLVPFAHRVLFLGKKTRIAVHNLGGISNLTYISSQRVLGFDTGPGNMLIDGLMGHLFNRPYDKDGLVAKKGKVWKEAVSKFLAHAYFERQPPKSTGREEFGGPFIRQWLSYAKVNRMKKEDLIATATYFTAKTIVDAYKKFIIPHGLDEVIFCGGGAKNQYLLKLIAEKLPVPMTTTAKYGYDVQTIEAAAFAILGYLGLTRKPNHIAELTGAKSASSLGQISWPD